ncbi:DUF308 domain-containing protein [uncultured Ruminococcus sp.]|uniref:HdeD family acid-resistance protein n=1 Tax=uncultured Ruminococcus sp. TaxID=165186 RepID=UPI0025FBC653|nr:DUF308 domain-containing protein [uncultured Ruminococcus sp.]
MKNSAKKAKSSKTAKDTGKENAYMEYIKKIFRNYWILSIFCVVLGIALIINPMFFTNAIGYVVGGLLTAYGVVALIRYFVKSKENPLYATGLVLGIILCIAGIFIIIRPTFVPKIIAIIFGLYMLISGICSLQDALNIRRAGFDSWKNSGIPAIITIVVGAVLVLDPILLTDAAMIILGVALLISGLTNIVSCFSAGRGIRKLDEYKKHNNNKKDDRPDIIDI